MGPVVLQTERVLLREWGPEDAEPFRALFDDADVARYITDGEPVTADAARRVAEHQMLAYRTTGWCRFALALREQPDRYIGFCGPGCTFAPEVEVGWTLERAQWGRGLATEAATEVLRFGFEVVGFDHLVSAIDPGNERSAAVARRLGMREEGTLTYDEHVIRRFVIDNPLADPPRDPRYHRGCEAVPTFRLRD